MALLSETPPEIGPNTPFNNEQVMSDLHSTLDIKHVLNFALSHLSQILDVTGIKYEYPQFNVNYSMGNITGHTIEHHLSLDEQNLGSVYYIRATDAYSNEDSALAQDFSNLLLLPLRNCLRYLEAVEASYTDQLTGMSNRAAFDHNLEKELNAANRYNLPLALLLVDIDDFKLVNDTHGHDVGDQVLKSVARSILNITRNSDTIYRYGGEEFAILMPHTEQDGAQILGNRICDEIQKVAINLPNGGKGSIQVTVSIGTTSRSHIQRSKEEFFKFADEALYQAKASGKNRNIYLPT